MALLAESWPSTCAPVRRLRGAVVWRGLQRVLPLGQRFNALIAMFVAPEGLIAVPWGRYRLIVDASWLRVPSTASAPIYRAPRRQNPEFFGLVAPLLEASRKGVIVDVGANIGVYTLNFRELTATPIVGFEPDPASFALLATTVADNGLPSVTLRNVACGDAPGSLNFVSGINGAVAADGDSGSVVPVVRLDDALAGQRIAFIKIDCEGYEWQVLNGCRDVIATQRPSLFVELHPKLISRYGHSLAQVCDLLRPHYHVAFWEADGPRRVRWRWLRFLTRFGSGLRRLADEREMLSRTAGAGAPDQIFLCATPRHAAA